MSDGKVKKRKPSMFGMFFESVERLGSKAASGKSESHTLYSDVIPRGAMHSSNYASHTLR